MPASVLYMSMSLDGYIAGPGDEPGHPGGNGFSRLHEWYGDFSRPSGPTGELHDELEATGAVLAGRRTWSRSITGAATMAAVRSSCPAISHRVPRWRITRW